MGDMKLRAAASECLLTLSEIATPQFVVGQVYKHAVSAKSPKVTAEAISWVATSIDEFGLGHFDIKALLDFIQQVLENSNPAVKKSALKLLVDLRCVMGSALNDMVHAKEDSIKPALLKVPSVSMTLSMTLPPTCRPQQAKCHSHRPCVTLFLSAPRDHALRSSQLISPSSSLQPALVQVIDAELGKVSTPDPQPQEIKREVRVSSGAKGGGGKGGGGGGGNGAAFELPRVDISSQITSKLLKELADTDWKARKAALAQIDEIITKAGKRYMLAGRIGSGSEAQDQDIQRHRIRSTEGRVAGGHRIRSTEGGVAGGQAMVQV